MGREWLGISNAESFEVQKGGDTEGIQSTQQGMHVESNAHMTSAELAAAQVARPGSTPAGSNRTREPAVPPRGATAITDDPLHEC